MTWSTALIVLAVGAGVGFLGGLFGKGGSAIATPLLAAAGLPAIVALASPLPATVPGTTVAAWQYWRQGRLDLRFVATAVAIGAPAAVLGSLATRWVGGDALVLTTDAVIAALGIRFLLRPHGNEVILDDPSHPTLRLVAVAAVAGFAAGLLANSGGFLLAPLFLTVLRLPIKEAFAASLAVSAALAVPGTVVHAALGHIDWTVVAVFGLASIPLSAVGARVAFKVEPLQLERIYGAALALLGTVFVLTH